MLQAHPSELQTYFSTDTMMEAHQDDKQYIADNISLDILTSINHAGVPPHKLHLKVGSLCCMLHNLSIEHGLVKNARVEIIALQQRTVDVKVIGREAVHCIPQINFNFHPHYSAWTINHRQFPLRTAYAMTFNSCQGLTLDCIVINICSQVFAHGQLYTVLSRVQK